MKISIIIPTKDRPEKLKKVITKLESQTVKNFEVIVINDGKGKLVIPKSTLLVRCYSSFGRGVSFARNIGINKSTGDILIFIGDDTYPDIYFIEEHFKFHTLNKEKNIAMLGLIKWYEPDSESILINKFLDGGIQFDFNSLIEGQTTDIYHFYTSNLSIKKRFIDFFDNDFKLACYEDIELGYRLSGKALKLIYNSKAIVFHDHKYNESLLIRRAKMMGKMYRLLETKIPGIKHNLSIDIIDKFKLIILYFLSTLKRYKLQYYHYLYISNFLNSYNT